MDFLGFHFGNEEKKEQYSKETYEKIEREADKEYANAFFINKPSIDEPDKLQEDVPLFNRWGKWQAANAKLAELYRLGRDEAYKYNELLDRARESIETFINFEKEQFGIDSKEDEVLDLYKKTVGRFENVSPKVMGEYELLKKKAIKDIEALSEYEDEIGIEKKEKGIVEF